MLLKEGRRLFSILHFSSYKARRATRSVLGAETYAIADAFDVGYTLAHDLSEILQVSITLVMSTDSKSLFSLITKDSLSTERRLMIDITSVRQSFDNGEIDCLELKNTDTNPSDAFKESGSNLSREQSIVSGQDNTYPVKWVQNRNK